MSTSSDPVVYAPAQLPQELEPHAHSEGINSFSAEDRFEMEQDCDADQEGPASDNGYDSSEEYHDCAVDQDQSFASSSPIDDQITSTPVDLAQPRKLVRRNINYSSPAVPTPALTIAYHTPPPTTPYQTNPRGLVRRTHAFIPAANSPNPCSSPTPAPSKRPISEVEGTRDERDDGHNSDDDEQDITTVLRAADLTPPRRRLFDVAVRHLRMLVISEAPYADAIQLHQLATTAWYAAQRELRETHGYEGVTAPTSDEISLLKARSHQVKGDIKTVAREVVVGKKGYDFKDDTTPDAIVFNRTLVTTLLTNNSFLYHDPMNHSLPGSLFAHTALQDLLNRVFYNNERSSDAVLTPKYFANGLPLKALGYLANALECVISERVTGERVKCRMSATTWEPKFQKHLKSLEGWKVYTTNSGSHMTQKLQMQMVQDARRYAQIDVTPAGVEDVGISTDDFAKNES
ncbi:hypothetical protein B0H14DRAFT_2559403 [Mycena olivaceomarginata]|nr:hypothetical protein B0H14DRAFT_2559403 [Mycena olivaceomarginata]